MRIELLYFDGCPGHEDLLPTLRNLLAEEEIAEEIELHRIDSLEEVERRRFLGSPTLRIDGVDVDPGAAGRDTFGLKCRPYRDRGAVSDVPSESWVKAALERTRPANEVT